eukprot:scaffold5790_cov101-Isochrysis_galbana.AAC.4
MADGTRGRTGVECLTARQQHELVKHLVDLRRRLGQVVHYAVRRGRVQARSRLIDDENARLLHQLDREAEPALLPARQALAKDITDDGMGGGAEADRLDRLLDDRLQLCRRLAVPITESRRLLERLRHSEHAEQRVILRDIRDMLVAFRRAEGGAVEGDRAFDLAARNPIGQRVKERGLPRAARPHNCQEVAG